MIQKKLYQLFFVASIVVNVFLLIGINWYSPTTEIHYMSRPIKVDETRRIILFTTKWWQGQFPYLKEANAFCPKCIFTQDESNWDISDAVVFHGRMLNSKIPQRSNSAQIWVFMTFETTLISLQSDKDVYKLMKSYDGLFNWTMTYRRDSDIFVPYGRFVSISEVPRPNSSQVWAFSTGAKKSSTYDGFKYTVQPSIQNFTEKRTGAWIVSRCKSLSLRETIISELSKLLDIDIYGNCGTKKCNVPKGKALNGVDCCIQIQDQYKFYFSFENSICQDYVTEKFFDASITEMVPVVYGGSDYKTMFPPTSM